MDALYGWLHAAAVYASRRRWDWLGRRLFYLSDDLADRLGDWDDPRIPDKASRDELTED